MKNKKTCHMLLLGLLSFLIVCESPTYGHVLPPGGFLPGHGDNSLYQAWMKDPQYQAIMKCLERPPPDMKGDCNEGQSRLMTALTLLKEKCPSMFDGLAFESVSLPSLGLDGFVGGHEGVILYHPQGPGATEDEEIEAMMEGMFLHYSNWMSVWFGGYRQDDMDDLRFCYFQRGDCWPKSKEKVISDKCDCAPARQNLSRSLNATAADECDCQPPPPPPPWGGGIGIQVVGSIDPNEKVGPGGVGLARYISEDAPVGYTIHFENVSTASAPAQIVTVEDQLDITKTDPSTFSFSLMTFGAQVVTPPASAKRFTWDVDLRTNQQMIVHIEAGIDTNTGLVTWRFTSLDPDTMQLPEDPFVGFLPPNNADHVGEGSVMYSVNLRPGWPADTAIENTASIVFDYNEAMNTPAVTNLLDPNPPSSQVQIYPANRARTYQVVWNGNDAESGLYSYDVYYSRDGEGYQRWRSGTADREGVFVAEPGLQYDFYSRARDNVGNTENIPSGPDATITEDYYVTYISCVNESGNENLIRWESATNKTYDIDRSTNLMQGFSTIVAGVPSMPPENTYTDVVGSASGPFWYRVKLNH